MPRLGHTGASCHLPGLTSCLRSSFCMTMCRALLPEMLMCSCSLSISGRSDSWNTSSSSFSFFTSTSPSAGGLARMGFTTPTCGMVTGMGGRAGVTPGRAQDGRVVSDTWAMAGDI